MMQISKILLIIFFILCVSIFKSLPVFAQQTIFNVPSADITANKHIFLNPQLVFRSWAPGRFYAVTNYSALGIGYNSEIDATLFNLNSPPTDNITLGTGFRSVIPIFSKKLSKREIKIIVGSQILASLQGQGAGNWSYGELSGRLPKLNTRMTAGVSFGTKQAFDRNVVCFIAGYEQPVTKNLSLIADWFSGTNTFGLFTSGFSYTLPKDVEFLIGYQLPNTRAVGFPGFVIQIEKEF